MALYTRQATHPPSRRLGLRQSVRSSDDSRYDWTDLLKLKLSNVGFQLDHNHVAWQKSLDLTHFDVHELSDAL